MVVLSQLMPPMRPIFFTAMSFIDSDFYRDVIAEQMMSSNTKSCASPKKKPAVVTTAGFTASQNDLRLRGLHR